MSFSSVCLQLEQINLQYNKAGLAKKMKTKLKKILWSDVLDEKGSGVLL